MLVQFTQDGYNLAFQDEKNIKKQSHFTFSWQVLLG